MKKFLLTLTIIFALLPFLASETEAANQDEVTYIGMDPAKGMY